jgi:hypothetical protein
MTFSLLRSPENPFSQPERADRLTNYDRLVGSFLRLVLAKSLSCFSDMESAIFFDAPFRLDLLRSPRLAANAAPAAICCFFDLAGIVSTRRCGK